MNGLSPTEVQTLEALSCDPIPADRRDTALAQVSPRLLVRGLVAYNNVDATLQITGAGERALFLVHCQQALQAMADGQTPTERSGVVKWLAKSGFVRTVNDAPPVVTERGRLWLASFDADEAAAAKPAAADDVVRRRRS